MNQRNKGILYLIPTPLSEHTAHLYITEYLSGIIRGLDYYLVENIRTARRFLAGLHLGLDIETISFEQVDKHATPEQIAHFAQPLLEGRSAGVLSEAGCPGIADPGALIVKFAHEQDIRVEPIIGPSSILMALMGSGFNGQSFTFHGYLPIDKTERKKAIRTLEKMAFSGQAQIFMETPYRNNQLLEDILRHCGPETKLCIASDITGTKQLIKTQAVRQWKSSVPDLHKTPTMFLLGA